jgi:hypothetical protein
MNREETRKLSIVARETATRKESPTGMSVVDKDSQNYCITITNLGQPKNTRCVCRRRTKNLIRVKYGYSQIP